MEDESAIEAIEMFVVGLVLDPNTQAPVVVLKDETGELHLPIWVGVAEATSIASAIKEIEMARPLTHDLMLDVIDQAGLRVERVFITSLKDSTYYSELILALGDRAVIFDARPSDAIAVALRASAPIFVTEEVLKQAQITFSGASSSGASGGKSHKGDIAGEETSQENTPQQGDQQGGTQGGADQGSKKQGSKNQDSKNKASKDLVVQDQKDQQKRDNSPRKGEGGKESQKQAGATSEEELEDFVQAKDFKSIDKEKWKEMLADLDPDDFKYKT